MTISKGRITPLSDTKPGESGTIIEITGGAGLINRLNSLGIIPRKRVKNVSSMFMRGPVTIEVDRSRVAIGFGMAQKILVQLDA